jgi:hypothetical protein
MDAMATRAGERGFADGMIKYLSVESLIDARVDDDQMFPTGQVVGQEE